MNDADLQALREQFSELGAERIRSALVAQNLWNDLDINSDGLAILSSDARPKLMNKAFETITGLSNFQQDDFFGPPIFNSANQTITRSGSREGCELRPNTSVGEKLTSVLKDGFLRLDVSLFKLTDNEIFCVVRQPKATLRDGSALRNDPNRAQVVRHSFVNFLAVMTALSDALPEEGGLSDSSNLGSQRMKQAVDKAIADLNAFDESVRLDSG